MTCQVQAAPFALTSVALLSSVWLAVQANFLTKYGSKVYIIHRRDDFRASKIMLKRAQSNPKVQVPSGLFACLSASTSEVELLAMWPRSMAHLSALDICTLVHATNAHNALPSHRYFKLSDLLLAVKG